MYKKRAYHVHSAIKTVRLARFYRDAAFRSRISPSLSMSFPPPPIPHAPLTYLRSSRPPLRPTPFSSEHAIPAPTTMRHEHGDEHTTSTVIKYAAAPCGVRDPAHECGNHSDVDGAHSPSSPPTPTLSLFQRKKMPLKCNITRSTRATRRSLLLRTLFSVSSHVMRSYCTHVYECIPLPHTLLFHYCRAIRRFPSFLSTPTACEHFVLPLSAYRPLDPLSSFSSFCPFHSLFFSYSLSRSLSPLSLDAPVVSEFARDVSP